MFKKSEIKTQLQAFREIESLDGKCPSCGFDRGYRHSYNCELVDPAREYRRNHTRYVEYLLDEYDRIKELLSGDKTICMKRIDELTEQLATARETGAK